MKRQMLFVQGGGKGTHDEWDNKLVESHQLNNDLGEVAAAILSLKTKGRL